LKTRVTVALKAPPSLKEQGQLSLDVFEKAHGSAKDIIEAVE
jgi:hypothetical protein